MAQEEELEELYGKISSVIYTNEENGWTVLRLDTMDGGLVTVVGTLPSAYPGEELHVFGEWTTHPNHGRQFRGEYAERSLPRTKEAIYSYLAGRAVKGIGPATAALIVDRFGEKTLDVLESEPERLTEIRGINPAKAEKISRDFRRQAGLRRLMEFLCSHDIKPLLAVRLYRFYGEEAMAVVSENPYIIAAPHIGGSFAEADHLAFDTEIFGPFQRIDTRLARHHQGDLAVGVLAPALALQNGLQIGAASGDQNSNVHHTSSTPSPSAITPRR